MTHLAGALNELGELDEALLVQLAWVLRLRGGTAEPDQLDVEITELAAFMQAIDRPYETPTYAGYLIFLGRYEQAEVCMLGNLESGRRSGREGRALHPEITDLIDLYEAWGKPQEAAKYRAMLRAPAPGSAGPR